MHTAGHLKIKANHVLLLYRNGSRAGTEQHQQQEQQQQQQQRHEHQRQQQSPHGQQRGGDNHSSNSNIHSCPQEQGQDREPTAL